MHNKQCKLRMVYIEHWNRFNMMKFHDLSPKNQEIVTTIYSMFYNIWCKNKQSNNNKG